MLNEMRSLSRNLFGRAILTLVLGFIIVSFAVWGIGDRFTGFNGNELAKVGATTITVDQYRNAYQTQLQQLQQKQRRAITNEEARRSGLDRQVLSRLLTDTILDQQAGKLGLAVGNDEIARGVMRDPAFNGPGGKFDAQVFQRLLAENGYSEASYARAQRALILRQDVSDAVIGDLALPAAITDAVHRYKSEVRDLDFFILPPAAAGEVPAPSEAEMKTFYDQHARSFTAPEFRKLTVLSVVPANLVKPDAVTDADVAKRYDEMKATRFTQAEKRTLQQLVFPDAKAADAAEAKLKGGESFAALAAEEHRQSGDIDLGTVAKSEVADPAVASAAFALPADGTSQPVKGSFGTVLVHVAAIVPKRVQPLIEVNAQLKDELAIVRARAQANAMRDEVEKARDAGKSLVEAAQGVGLQARSIDAIDAQGRDRARKPVEGLAGGPQLLKAAFGSDVGADTSMIPTGDGGDVWYAVDAIDPAHPLALAAVKDRVIAGWREDEIARRLAGLADKLVAAIDGGKPLGDAAAESGKLAVLKASNIGRGGAPQLPQPVASAFFTRPAGKAGSVTDGAAGRIVFRIAAVHVPPVDAKDEEFTKLIGQVQTGFEDDVMAQYLAREQSEIGVTINQQALVTALGDSGS